MKAPVVIFAVGNPSRGDDAIGPELYGQLEKWLKNENLLDGFELIEDFQLQIEHVIDLQGRQLALFIDAGDNTPAPFTFKRIAPAIGIAHTSHALPPEAVLQVFVQTERTDPPPAFVLCVRGEQFELGAPLSSAAEINLKAAFSLLQTLSTNAHLSDWDQATTN